MRAAAARRTPGRRELLSRENLGFLLAKASQRWNELLGERFAARGFPEVRPSYGSILIPLFEEDELPIGVLGRRARLSKQTMTTMVRLLERDGLVDTRPDPADGRVRLVCLTRRAREFEPVAAAVVAELEALVEEHLDRSQRIGLRAGAAALLRL